MSLVLILLLKRLSLSSLHNFLKKMEPMFFFVLLSRMVKKLIVLTSFVRSLIFLKSTRFGAKGIISTWIITVYGLVIDI